MGRGTRERGKRYCAQGAHCFVDDARVEKRKLLVVLVLVLVVGWCYCCGEREEGEGGEEESGEGGVGGRLGTRC